VVQNTTKYKDLPLGVLARGIVLDSSRPSNAFGLLSRQVFWHNQSEGLFAANGVAWNGDAITANSSHGSGASGHDESPSMAIAAVEVKVCPGPQQAL
jgi:hypothetical protein